MKRKYLLATLLGLLSVNVSAQDVIAKEPTSTLNMDIQEEKSFKEKLWISPGMVSLHFERNMGFNEQNPGFGLEYAMNKDWSLAAGRFKNSEYNQSNYVTVAYQPLDFFGFRLGVVGGVMDGYMGPNNKYDKKPFPMLLPVMTYEHKNVGVNILFVPTVKTESATLYGALGVQFKIKAFNF
jgi:hypothetical protein